MADLGSGMNDHNKGLKRLVAGILDDPVGRLVLAHKEELLRFGAELVCLPSAKPKTSKSLSLNQGEDYDLRAGLASSRTCFEQDLAKDVLEIITVFSTRLYGSRSRKNRKLLEGIKRAVKGSRQ